MTTLKINTSDNILHAIENNLNCDEIITLFKRKNIYVDQRICNEILHLQKLYVTKMKNKIALDNFYLAFDELVNNLISISPTLDQRINIIVNKVNLPRGLGPLVSKYDFYLRGVEFTYDFGDLLGLIVTDDGRLLLRKRKTVLVFDPKKKEIQREIDLGLRHHLYQIFTTKNELITKIQKNLKVWNIDTGLLEQNFDGIAPSPILLMDNLMVIANDDLDLIIWNLDSNSIEFKLTGHTGEIRVIESLGQNYIASGSNNGELKVWDLNEGNCVASFIHEFPKGENSGEIYFISALPGNRIASASTTLRIWSIDTNLLLHEIKILDIKDFYTVNTKKGKMIAGLSWSSILYIWNIITGELEQQFMNINKLIVVPSKKEDKIIVSHIGKNRFPDDENFYLPSTGKEAQKINVISPTDGIIYSFNGHNSEVTGMMKYSPIWRNSMITISEDGEILIWDYETGSIKRRLQGTKTQVQQS